MDNRLDPIYEELDRYGLSKDEILLRYYNICKDYKCETCIFKEFSMIYTILNIVDNSECIKKFEEYILSRYPNG